jgi:hypothetical protein
VLPPCALFTVDSFPLAKILQKQSIMFVLRFRRFNFMIEKIFLAENSKMQFFDHLTTLSKLASKKEW